MNGQNRSIMVNLIDTQISYIFYVVHCWFGRPLMIRPMGFTPILQLIIFFTFSRIYPAKLDRFKQNLADRRDPKRVTLYSFQRNLSSDCGSDFLSWKQDFSFVRYYKTYRFRHLPFIFFSENWHEHANECPRESYRTPNFKIFPLSGRFPSPQNSKTGPFWVPPLYGRYSAADTFFDIGDHSFRRTCRGVPFLRFSGSCCFGVIDTPRSWPNSA